MCQFDFRNSSTFCFSLLWSRCLNGFLTTTHASIFKTFSIVSFGRQVPCWVWLGKKAKNNRIKTCFYSCVAFSLQFRLSITLKIKRVWSRVCKDAKVKSQKVASICVLVQKVNSKVMIFGPITNIPKNVIQRLNHILWHIHHWSCGRKWHIEINNKYCKSKSNKAMARVQFKCRAGVRGIHAMIIAIGGYERQVSVWISFMQAWIFHSYFTWFSLKLLNTSFCVWKYRFSLFWWQKSTNWHFALHFKFQMVKGSWVRRSGNQENKR